MGGNDLLHDVRLEISRHISSICILAYLAASNVLLPHNPDEVRKRQRKRLSDACRAYGIEGWERIDKETIATDIGRRPLAQVRTRICFELLRRRRAKVDVLLLIEQLRGRHHLPAVKVDHVLHWSNYSAKTVAQIQARGMPVDMLLWNSVQEHKLAVIRELLRRFDPSQGSDDAIFTPEGEWSYGRFERWLVSIGVTAWPRTDTGLLANRQRRFPHDVSRAGD